MAEAEELLAARLRRADERRTAELPGRWSPGRSKTACLSPRSPTSCGLTRKTVFAYTERTKAEAGGGRGRA